MRRFLLRAFDLHKHELSVAFACYLARRNDPTWKEPLRVATQIYVEANGPITADTSLVLAQTVLELISWVRFPHAIVAMRNALIHPRQRERLLRTPTMARIELQELALSYVELALLRLIDFNGFYLNRLGEKVTGIVEAVPWRHATCER